MPARNKIHKIFISLLTLFIFSCASTNAPRGWLASPTEMQTETYGGWLQLNIKTQAQLVGELIAISKDSIYIVNESFYAIAQSDIKSARMVIYESNSVDMGGLVALGTLSTISNGFYLILTAPMWIIGGSIASGKRSFEPIVDYPKQELSHFTPYARFPQGLPKGIDRSQIRKKAY